MGGNYAGIPAACFADDRGDGGRDEHDDDSIVVKVYNTASHCSEPNCSRVGNGIMQEFHIRQNSSFT